jgi:hypothetical protein
VIHHLSIGARAPERVAEVLAECMGGVAIPFPPHPGSFFALALDEHGTGVEVYPAGTELHPAGDEGGRFIQRPTARRFCSTHFALSVKIEAEQIAAIARREGWDCFCCNRGFFSVVELWIENAVLVELLPPAFAQQYLDFAKEENISRMLMARAA